MRELHEIYETVMPQERILAMVADPDDNAVLECAKCAAAALIVSGDAHLLDVGEWCGIRILTPAAAVVKSSRTWNVACPSIKSAPQELHKHNRKSKLKTDMP